MKNFLILILLLLPFSLNAQTKDRVYLKNGSVINCNIIEMYPDSVIKFKTQDGSLFVYETDKVLKTETTQNIKLNEISDNPNRKTRPLSKGYRGFVELGAGSDMQFESTFLSFSTTHGYQFDKHWFVGGGVTYFGDLQSSDFFLPVYVCGRFTTRPRSGFFVDSKIGYDFTRRDGCFYVELTPGYRFAITKKFAIGLGLSCISIPDEFGALMMKVGFDF